MNSAKSLRNHVHYGGFRAVKPTCDNPKKQSDTHLKITDNLIIDFCLKNCPHENCSGKRCQELIDFSNSIKGASLNER